MSFSQPTVSNPCEKWIGFKGSSGAFKFWDKEQEEEVELKLPLKFIVLDDRRSKISGYNKASDSGVWSNEVQNTKKEELHVRTWKGGDEVKGLYSDIKGKIIEMGGKFTKSIYAALVTKDGLELVNFELRGAALAAWFKWSKNKKDADFRKMIVMVTGTVEDKTGNITYKMPVFSQEPMRPEFVKEAERIDRKLQHFFRQRAEQAEDEGVYFEEEEAEIGTAANAVEEAEIGTAANAVEDGLPF